MGGVKRDVDEELARWSASYPRFGEIWAAGEESIRLRHLRWMSEPWLRAERRWRVRCTVIRALENNELRVTAKAGDAWASSPGIDIPR